jgi:hypothetical protein
MFLRWLFFSSGFLAFQPRLGKRSGHRNRMGHPAAWNATELPAPTYRRSISGYPKAPKADIAGLV